MTPIQLKGHDDSICSLVPGEFPHWLSLYCESARQEAKLTGLSFGLKAAYNARTWFGAGQGSFFLSLGEVDESAHRRCGWVRGLGTVLSHVSAAGRGNSAHGRQPRRQPHYRSTWVHGGDVDSHP